MTTYTYTLSTLELPSDTPIRNPIQKQPKVSLTDPAIVAMTDLKNVTAITIDADSTIDLALEVMRHASVRLLLVVNKEELIIGIITARDISGEKPLKIIERERIRHDEIQVYQIMTPREELNFFDIEDIKHATVQNVIQQLNEAGRQHSIVIEKNEDQKSYCARGIFSITQIGRQLGMDVSPDGHVQSFSEFEKLIA